MYKMAPPPQKPKASHAKKISVVTISRVETSDVNNMGPASRGTREIRKFGGGRTSGVGLDPRPSEDIDDPLVGSFILQFLTVH